MKPQNGNEGESQQQSNPEETTDHRSGQIARRAYEKWQARGCPEGDDRRDWFEAEQEVVTSSGAPLKGTERARARTRA